MFAAVTEKHSQSQLVLVDGSSSFLFKFFSASPFVATVLLSTDPFAEFHIVPNST